METPVYWTSPSVLMISPYTHHGIPSVLMVSPSVLNTPRCTQNIPHTHHVIPHCTHGIPYCIENIRCAHDIPPVYWTPPCVLHSHYAGWKLGSSLWGFTVRLIKNLPTKFTELLLGGEYSSTHLQRDPQSSFACVAGLGNMSGHTQSKQPGHWKHCLTLIPLNRLIYTISNHKNDVASLVKFWMKNTSRKYSLWTLTRLVTSFLWL